MRSEMALVDAAMRSRLKRAGQQRSRIMLAHNQYLRARNLLSKKTRRLQTVQARHADVKKDDIGQKVPGFFDRLRPIFCLTAHLPIRLGCENVDHALPDPLVIVNHKNSHDIDVTKHPSQTDYSPTRGSRYPVIT